MIDGTRNRQKLRYGIIGFGRFAENRLLPAFQKARNAELVAIQKRDRQAARERASQYGIPFAFSNPEELVAHPEVDVVLVTSPPAQHKLHTVMGLQAGKPVVVEKPMACDASECQEMIHAAREARLPLISAFVMRYLTVIERLKSLVQGGEAGEIHYVEGIFTLQASPEIRSWLEDPQTSCGGPVADLAPHLIDLLQFILEDSIVDVKALQRPIFSPDQIERQAVAAFQFAKGTLGSLYVSFDLPRYNALIVRGTRGTLETRNFSQAEQEVEIVLNSPEGTERYPVFNENHYRKFIEAVSQALIEQSDVPIPGEVGWQVQQVIDKIYQQN